MKVLCFTDLTVLRSQLFWHRDLGLLTKAFRSLGHDAWLVVHPATEANATPAAPNNLDLPREQPCVAQQGLPRPSVAGQPSHSSNDPVLWASPSDVRSPAWWQSHKPDLVILGLWTRPKYDPIRLAALAATPRVIERADSDGMRTASCGFLTYAKRRFDYFRDRTYRWPPLLSVPASVLYSFTSLLATPWMEARLARTLRLLPAVVVETPQATRLWRQLARRLGTSPSRIRCLPHPVAVSVFRPSSRHHRPKRILCVGRWESYQKNLRGLVGIVADFLRKHRAWRAEFIGSGLNGLQPLDGIRFFSPCSPQALARRMRSCRLLVYASRYESFFLAGAEALCCGTRVVGPAGLVTTSFFDLFSDRPRQPQKSLSLAENLEKAAGLEPLRPATVKSVRCLLDPARIAARLFTIASQSLRKAKSHRPEKKPG